MGSHTACNDMQASHRPRGNGILLKPLMGPYGIMNTLRRARALIVGPQYLDTYIITQSDESVANSAALRMEAHRKQIAMLPVREGGQSGPTWKNKVDKVQVDV